MKNLPLVLAIVGLVLLVMSTLIRIPGGLLFSPRGILEFTQAVLLTAIAFGVIGQAKK
ncbi:MAG TPA: hypothetical protein PKL97_03860 [Candidatus Omnitrophota bacterium]|nr:hypothetical protein [Candidatus Omnitrophota bacterium]